MSDLELTASFLKPGPHIVSIRRRPIGVTTALRKLNCRRLVGDMSPAGRRQPYPSVRFECLCGLFCFFGKQKRFSNMAALNRLACDGHLITWSTNNLLAHRRQCATLCSHIIFIGGVPQPSKKVELSSAFSNDCGRTLAVGVLSALSVLIRI